MKNPYTNIPAAMWLLATVTLISRSGSMVIVFLSLYLTQRLGFDIITSGQIVSLYGLGQIAGSYSGGIFTDKLGAIKVQTFSLFLVGILYILLEFLNIKFMIMLCMFFAGLFTASIRPATNETITRLCTSDIRPHAYTLNYQAINIGTSIGPLIGGVLASISYMWVFRLDGIANVLASLALWMFFHNQSRYTSQHTKPYEHNSHVISAWKDRQFIIFLFLILIIGICFSQILNIYPLYLSNIYHLSTNQIGMIMSFNGILIILFQMIITEVLKDYNAIRVISIGGILTCTGYFILPFYSGFYYALLSISIITFGEMLTMPFAFEIVTKLAPASYRGQYFGLLACALSSAPLFITPNLASYIYSSFGSKTLWYSMGLISMIIYVGFKYLNQTSFGSRINATECLAN